MTYISDVIEDYHLSVQVFFIAQQSFDIFMKHNNVERNQWQLAAACCVMIASKFVDRYPLQTVDVFKMLHYPKGDILQMEGMIICSKFVSVSRPTAWDFMEKYVDCVKIDHEGFPELVCYIMQLCIYDKWWLSFRHSKIAAAAFVLARMLMGQEPVWPQTLVDSTGYGFSEINLLILRAKERLKKAKEYQKLFWQNTDQSKRNVSLYDFYAKERHFSVSVVFRDAEPLSQSDLSEFAQLCVDIKKREKEAEMRNKVIYQKHLAQEQQKCAEKLAKTDIDFTYKTPSILGKRLFSHQDA